MYKILFIIIGYLSLVPSLFADGDMTTTSFTIKLNEMDPLGHTNTAPGGKEALRVILGNIADILLYMIPIIAIISTLIAGYYYIFSAGDSEKAGKAKTIIKWNIIAIIVGFMSWSIINLIASLFS